MPAAHNSTCGITRRTFFSAISAVRFWISDQPGSPNRAALRGLRQAIRYYGPLPIPASSAVRSSLLHQLTGTIDRVRVSIFQTSNGKKLFKLGWHQKRRVDEGWRIALSDDDCY
jgi:hypothetical protein